MHVCVCLSACVSIFAVRFLIFALFHWVRQIKHEHDPWNVLSFLILVTEKEERRKHLSGPELEFLRQLRVTTDGR